MKIVYVYPEFTILAGTERVLIDKMNYLANQEGFEVVVITHEQGNQPFAYPLSSKVTHVDLNVRFLTLYRYNILVRLIKRKRYKKLLVVKFYKLISDIRPNIVVATTYHPYILTLINSCPGHFRKVLESHIDKCYLHSNDPLIKRNLIKRIRNIRNMNNLNREAGSFDILVSLHHKDAVDWSKYLRTQVIINVVHLNDTARISNQESKHIIFVGRYTIQKGIPDLFNIWNIVFHKYPDWHLDLYGDGDIKEIPYTEEYRKNKNIHVHSSDPDIFSRYIESSIFVLTSLYEPFGLVIVEAMSCGLPVIAFDCPSGPANIINDGVDGFLIKNRDVDEFAGKLCMLIEYPQLRLEIGKSAVQSSLRYSAEHVMPQWIKLYNDLLSNSKA